MILGLDLDGCLYDFHDAAFTYYQYEMGFTGTYIQFWTDFWNSLSKEKQDYIVSIPILYDMKVPSKQIENFLKLCEQKCDDVFYITSRHQDLERVTRRYMSRYGYPFLDNLILTNDKASACKLYGVTHFLDDFEKHVEPVSNICDAYLMAKPWNVEAQNKLKTVHSIREFQNVVFGG